MFLLLLESILLYANLDENTHILVYTSAEFMDMIKQNRLFDDTKIVFDINDTYNNIDSACKSRLDLFHLSSINNYEKILYLDTDILIKNNINRVFDICKDDILYVLEEGHIDNISDFWGNTLFGNETQDYEDKTAFTSGILLFSNCENIRVLFQNVKDYIVCRPYDFVCYDQPYIIYNAFKYKSYNNKLLKSLAINNNEDIDNDIVINHFPGGPGHYQTKLITMTRVLDKLRTRKP